jgi:hypothetical protein
MMDASMIENGDGTLAARVQKRRFWRTATLAALGAVGVGAIVVVGKTAPGKMTPATAIAAVTAMAILLPLTIRGYNRVRDELDSLDALKANSFGLYFFLLGQFAWMVLSSGGLVPPPNAMAMFLATGVATLARYAMFKFAR